MLPPQSRHTSDRLVCMCTGRMWVWAASERRSVGWGEASVRDIVKGRRANCGAHTARRLGRSRQKKTVWGDVLRSSDCFKNLLLDFNLKYSHYTGDTWKDIANQTWALVLLQSLKQLTNIPFRSGCYIFWVAVWFGSFFHFLFGEIDVWTVNMRVNWVHGSISTSSTPPFGVQTKR